jgi:RecA/RadA recombinase
MERATAEPLSTQMKRRAEAKPEKEEETKLDGNFEIMTSTGSTLVDLAISGSRIRGGGIPGGILVEAFGISQSGKTAFLCEVAGDIQRRNGEAQFHDPEARLDHQYFEMYGVRIKPENYYQPDTVTEVFKNVRKWEPPVIKDKKIVHGIFADSLAALSTDLEMGEDDGDKMGMRRAKEFSEQLRKTCRMIKQNNYLMVCSNQVRVNMGAGTYSPKFTTPGGEAFKFYASVRLHFGNPEKIYKVVKVAGKEVKKVIGITTMIEVVKTVDKPYRKAPMTIIFDYGIDQIRDNLQYIKDYTRNTTYCLGDRSLATSMEEAIKIIESEKLEDQLKEEVIDLWEMIESKFESNRKPKR